MPRKLIYIVILATIFRLFLFGGILSHFGSEGLMLSDSWGFYHTGVNLIAGHGFSQEEFAPFIPGTRFPPIYPILIACSLFLANSIIPLILLQIILSSLLPILVYRIVEFLTKSKSILYGAAILTAFEPLLAYVSLTVLTDTTALFLMLVGVIYLLRFSEHFTRRNAALSALFMGLSALTRPEAYYISILIGLIILVVAIRKNFLTALTFIFVFAAVVSPWLIRNYVQFNTVSIATTGVRNVHSSLATSIITYKTGKPYHEVAIDLRTAFAKKYGINPDEITTNPALGGKLVEEGLQIIKDNPRATIATLLLTTSTFFTQDLYLTYLNHYEVLPRIEMSFSPTMVLFKEGPIELMHQVWNLVGSIILIPLFGRLLWVLLSILFVIGSIIAIRKRGKERVAGLIITGLILIYAAGSISVGFSDHGRHRARISPLIFVMASYGLVETWSKFKREANPELL